MMEPDGRNSEGCGGRGLECKVYLECSGKLPRPLKPGKNCMPREDLEDRVQGAVGKGDGDGSFPVVPPSSMTPEVFRFFLGQLF